MKSPCCKQPWYWNQIGGMRVFRQAGRRKIYRVMCPGCRMLYETNGRGKVLP
jgi:hypothetical protein